MDLIQDTQSELKEWIYADAVSTFQLAPEPEHNVSFFQNFITWKVNLSILFLLPPVKYISYWKN